jgi:geranylgeranyl pyrophosphate synthase
MSERHELDETLLEAFRYINSVPGKDVRGILVDCFQIWLNVTDATKLDQIKDIIGDLHNASLLIDDIEDNSKLRRGNPVAHSIFGVPNVINTANYVYFLALEKCQNLDNPRAMKVFVGELLNLHRGQGHDIVVRLSAAHTYYMHTGALCVVGQWLVGLFHHITHCVVFTVPTTSGETRCTAPQRRSTFE